MTCAEIGRQAKPPVTRMAVHLSVHKTEEYFRNNNYTKVSHIKGRHAVALEKIFRRAIEAYDRSVGTHSVTTVKTSTGDPTDDNDVPSEDTTIRYEEMHGNMACLSEARAALADIRKIWGAEAPTKSSIEINSNEVDGLPQMNAYGSHAEALAAASKMLAERAEAEAARAAGKVEAVDG